MLAGLQSCSPVLLVRLSTSAGVHSVTIGGTSVDRWSRKIACWHALCGTTWLECFTELLPDGVRASTGRWFSEDPTQWWNKTTNTGGAICTRLGVQQGQSQCGFRWQNHVIFQIAGCDNRRNKSPDFRQKTTSKALHIYHWNRGAMRAGAVSFEAGSGFDVECAPENIINLRLSQWDEYSWTALISKHVKCGQGRQALKLYEEMQSNKVQPSPRTFVALLKACRSLQDLESARRIHAEVAQSGYESNIYVGTMLVDMYVKCGSLVEARHAFDRLPSRDVVAWTAMILGYAQMNKGEEALHLYMQMQQDGVVPDGWTYVSALKACSTIAESGEGGSTVLKEGCLETVRAIHIDIVKRNFDSGVFVGTMLVDTYAKCRSLDDARYVFERMPQRDVVSWNAMILGYAQMDNGQEALQLYKRMQQEGVTPNCRTYVSALKACSTLIPVLERNKREDIFVEQEDLVPRSARKACGDVMFVEQEHAVPCSARKACGPMPTPADRTDVAPNNWCLAMVTSIHADIVSQKLESNMFIANMLVDVYAKFGRLKQARCVFEEMPCRDVVSWNSVILGYAQLDKGEEALGLYTQMQQEGVVPDGRTYVSALKACTTMAESARTNEDDGINVQDRCLESIRAIHTDIMKGKFDSDVFVGNMLVDAYSKCGCLEDARCVFEKMSCRDVISWNAMILGYAHVHKGEEALQLYTRMQMEGMVPAARTYGSALKACGSLVELDDRNEVDGNGVKERCLETVRSIHTDIVKARVESDVFVANILVDVYAKCGSLEDATRVFEKMSNRDVVTWTAMILGYAQMDRGEEALQLYTRMQLEGVVPDGRTYIAALNACGSVAGLERGKEIHAQILKAGQNAVDFFVTDSLIDMYSKCGSMVDAQNVFDEVPRKEIVAWNALMWGYAHQGECEIVFDLFHRMNHGSIQPNSITFLAVLTVCSHMGLVEMGQKYFKAMSRDYGITPTIKHFTCIIDLLGRAGHLDRAMEIVKEMPFQPHSALWRCILGACQKWGYVDLGRQVFDCAVKLNKDDCAAYVLMSNIYSAAHMREEAKAMRTKLQALKQPGLSSWTDDSQICLLSTATSSDP